MKIVKGLALFLAALLLVPIAGGTRPQEAKGSFTGTPTVVDFRSAGPNNITTFKTSFVITGTFSGTCRGTERDVSHPGGKVTFQGTCTFLGSVGSKSGNATIRYVGLVTATSPGGQFVMVRGAGGLTGVHAVGSFNATGPGTGTYLGRYHFDRA